MLTIALHLAAWTLAALWGVALLGRLLRRADPSFRLEPSGPEPLPAPAPRVSVVVPARNEVHNIGACVDALLASDYPDIEVLVVDDRSEDGTGEEVRRRGDPRLRVIEGEPPPDGWAGKPAACQRGAEEADGEWLLFVDADVQLAPWTIRRAVQTANARSVGLLSLWGTWALGSFWERLLIPVIGGFVRAAHPLERINSPENPAAFANGQFMLFAAEAYREGGGHARVASCVLEDVLLGRAMRAEGHRVELLLAPRAFRVRLYRSLGDIWAGFSKNMYAGMSHRPSLALLAAAFVGSVHLGPLVAVAAALVPGLGTCGLAGLISLGCMWSVRLLDDRDARRRDLLCAALHPVGNGVLVGIILNSMLRHHLGATVAWKGRHVRP